MAPAFAMTSHAAQGQTLRKGAIVDLCIGKGANPLGSYVALTRVQNRKHLLIYRPFPRDCFCNGVKEGPDLLLQLLRGEHVDWKAIEQKYMPSCRCDGCNFVKWKEDFTDGQWKRKDKLHFCIACIKQKEVAGTPYRCNVCALWLAAEAFEERFRHPQCLTTRVCFDDIERRQCRGACGEWKDQEKTLRGKGGGWRRE